MYPRPDLATVHRHDELIAGEMSLFQVDQQRVEVQSMAGIRLKWGREGHGKSGKGILIPPPDLQTPLPVGIDPRDLMHADRSLEVHHVVFEPHLVDVVVPVAFIGKPTPRIRRHPVKCKPFDPFGHGIVVGEHHSPLSRHDVLR